MKTFIYESYGGPEVLKMKDVDMPVPKKNEVCIRVYATSVSAGDWRMRKADPITARFYNGLFKPKRVQTLGFELSGIVMEVGSEVTKYKTGDKVLGSCGIAFGAYAEYRCLKETDELVIIPEDMSYEKAAVIPIGSTTALRFLRKANIDSAKKVLIYGASGSVGTYAVQIAKSYGTEVTAVCSTKNVDLVESLGADTVVDYHNTKLSELDTDYDLVFDAVDKASKAECKARLKSGGKYVSVHGNAKQHETDLQTVIDLYKQDKLKPVIDRIYTFNEIPDAHAYVEKGHKKGNVAIKVVD